METVQYWNLFVQWTSTSYHPDQYIQIYTKQKYHNGPKLKFLPKNFWLENTNWCSCRHTHVIYRFHLVPTKETNIIKRVPIWLSFHVTFKSAFSISLPCSRTSSIVFSAKFYKYSMSYKLKLSLIRWFAVTYLLPHSRLLSEHSELIIWSIRLARLCSSILPLCQQKIMTTPHQKRHTL